MTAFSLPQVLHTATSQVLASMAECVDKTLQQMGPQALAAHSNVQRQVLQRTERELQFKKGPLLAAFGESYRKAMAQYLGADVPGEAIQPKETDWTSLSLVDDAEVERGVQADRLAQQISQGCEAELEVLSACLAGLNPTQSAEQHPLRPRAIAECMLEAVAKQDCDDDVHQALGQHLGRVLGEMMGPMLARIANDWREQGIRPQGLAVQRTRSTTVSGHSRVTAPASLSGVSVSSMPGHLPAPHAHPTQAHPTHSQAANAGTHAQAQWQAAQALSQMFGMGMPNGLADPGGMPAFSATGLMPPGATGPGESWGSYAGRGQSAALARADFQDLIRQIASATPSSEWQAMQGADIAAQADAQWTPDAHTPAAQPYLAQGLAGPMMAVNVIRAHRDELVRASGGAPIDQMVIDIVAALFDQVLSDPKVAPQMARQIARLQMPVLRVALADMGFFNSRKHPVRRFVNRIATLSAAFDDPESASGQACLARITQLVNDVVEGDFERMDLFEAKLAELEAFVEAENAAEASEHARVAELLMLQAKMPRSLALCVSSSRSPSAANMTV